MSSYPELSVPIATPKPFSIGATCRASAVIVCTFVSLQVLAVPEPSAACTILVVLGLAMLHIRRVR